MENRIHLNELRDRLLQNALPDPTEPTGLPDGAQYLHRFICRPLMAGESPDMSRLDLSRFSLQDAECLYDYMNEQYFENCYRVERWYINLYGKAPRKTRQAYL